MRPTPLALAFVLAMLPSALSSPAWAQGTIEDPPTVAARARFKEGVDFFDKGEYEQARASFLQAYALKKHPAVLLNLAWSSLRGGHLLEAERHFKQFLAESKEISDKQRADANDGLAQAHARLGRIDVAAAPGTDVTIDGERLGAAPLAETPFVEAGAHTVKFKATDGTVETQSVSVLGGERAFVRFGRAPAAASPPTPPASAPAPLAAGAPPPPPAAPPPQETPAVELSPATPETPSPDGGGKPLFGAPKNVAPAIFLGTLAVAGGVTAMVLYLVKSSAQDKADQVASQIAANAPNGNTMGICTNPTPKFANACAALTTDTNDVNNDATAGNVALVLGLSAAAGSVVYWFVADKGEPNRPAARTTVAPLLGPSLGGVSLAGIF